MSFLVDIIQAQVIDKLPLEIEVTSIDDKTIYVPYTYFLREGSIIKDSNDVEFKIESFVSNESITVTQSGFVGNVNCRKPEFMCGTQLSTNREYLQKSNHSEDKLPMIWLIDPWDEQGADARKTLEYSARCTFFFLDTLRPNDLNEDIRNEAQRPMFNLMDIFLKTINENIEYFNIVTDFQKRPRTRFGTETTQGTDATIIDDFLTGGEIQATIEVIKSDAGCPFTPKTPTVITCADGTAIALNSNGDEIKRWTVPSGEEVSEYINDTAIRVRNSNDDIVATDVSLAGALGIDVALPDTNYIINYGGTSTSFDLPTLADEIITFNFT